MKNYQFEYIILEVTKKLINKIIIITTSKCYLNILISNYLK